jgi:hypothetical protein
MTDPELEARLHRLARSVARVAPPDEIEAAVLAEFDRRRRRGGQVSTVRWGATALALAASLVAGVVLLRPHPKTAPLAESQTFLPIPYTPPLEPYERVTVVEADVPVRALLAAGFRVQTSDPGGSVRADVLVSQDGRPRAIRPVSFNDAIRSSQ